MIFRKMWKNRATFPQKTVKSLGKRFKICRTLFFLRVEMSVFFQKRIAGGLFGGEGFIMQRLSGNGTVFLEFDGHIKEYELAPGQQIVVDTGYLAAMTAGCTIDIQTVPGVKNMLFGGEGIFNTVITGPGRVWLQSMPVAQLAGAISPFIPNKN